MKARTLARKHDPGAEIEPWPRQEARSRRRWDSRPRSDYDVLPESRTQRHFLIQIGAAAADYRTGEKAVGTSSLFSCRTGRPPLSRSAAKSCAVIAGNVRRS